MHRHRSGADDRAGSEGSRVRSKMISRAFASPSTIACKQAGISLLDRVSRYGTVRLKQSNSGLSTWRPEAVYRFAVHSLASTPSSIAASAATFTPEKRSLPHSMSSSAIWLILWYPPGFKMLVASHGDRPDACVKQLFDVLDGCAAGRRYAACPETHRSEGVLWDLTGTARVRPCTSRCSEASFLVASTGKVLVILTPNSRPLLLAEVIQSVQHRNCVQPTEDPLRSDDHRRRWSNPRPSRRFSCVLDSQAESVALDEGV